MASRRLSRFARTALLVAAAAGAVAFAVLRPRLVRTHRIDRGAVIVDVLGSGTLESRRTIDLAFEVPGRIAMLGADQGDAVAPGQVLARLDDEPYRAEVAVATEEAKLAESALARLDAEATRATSVLAAADARLARIRSLPQGARSQQELDDLGERRDVALAELERAKAAKVEGTQRLETARRALETTKVRLERTEVASPFAGVVLRRAREVGDVAVVGAPVLRVAATDVTWASAWIDETALGRVQKDQPVRVRLRSAASEDLRGRVARIGREVDRETRELLVDVILERVPERHALGQRLDLWIEVARRPDVVRLPSSFLARSGGREGAWLLADGRARFRPLELGERGVEWVEVQGGLSEGVVVAAARAGDPPLGAEDRIAAEPPDGATP